MMSLAVNSKANDLVKCVVVDGGELKSRRLLNVRGKSATLPSITDKDWEDIKFRVDSQVDFYAVSFVKDAKVAHELKDNLKNIHVIVKIESADSIPNLHSIISASDVAMVACGDLAAELSIEEVPIIAGINESHMGEIFAFHSTTIPNTLKTPIIVFTRTGSMAVLLSHYRPSSTIFAFTNHERIKRRLVLYQGVMPIYMQFSDDAEETFSRAIKLLMDKSLVIVGEYVTLVQSEA